jgi:hypothetical protein
MCMFVFQNCCLVVLSCDMSHFCYNKSGILHWYIATSIVNNLSYIGNTSQLGDIVGHSKWSERPYMPHWSATINFSYSPPNFHSQGCKQYEDFLVSQWPTLFWLFYVADGKWEWLRHLEIMNCYQKSKSTSLTLGDLWYCKPCYLIGHMWVCKLSFSSWHA